tara:strand:- start:350 stop:1156 length:807 start_codon:yes stop_codon:yes gene_type:complete
MIVCGITGHNGNLGKQFIKVFNKFKFEKFQGNIANKKDVDNWVKTKEFDLILHFASVVPTTIVNKNYKHASRVNYNGTKFLIDSLINNKKKIKWFFFSSTSHVYGKSNHPIRESFLKKPSSKYGMTKLNAEKYIKKKLKTKNINYCIGRIFSIADNQKKEFLIPNLIKKIKSKKNKFEDLNHYRDFITTKQISKIINSLWLNRFSGVINIANGKKIFLKNLAIYLSKKYKKKIIFNDNKKSTKVIANIDKLIKIKYRARKLKFTEFFN